MFLRRCLFLFVLMLSGNSYAQIERITAKNYRVFTGRQVIHDAELNRIPEHFQSHPEIGIMPLHCPPSKNCIEMIDRRDAYSRYFVEKGSGGTHFFRQQAYSPINYLDSAGWWCEINSMLEADETQKGVFVSRHQPAVFSINLNGKFVELSFKGRTIRFNKNLRLVHISDSGDEKSLGEPDWKNYSAGDDGVLISEFYPGIDAVFTMGTGMIETSFILKQRLKFSDGFLVMKQEFDFSDDLNFLEFPGGITGEHTELHLVYGQKIPLLSVEKCYAFDNSEFIRQRELPVKIENSSTLLVYTPCSWLNDPATAYPVIIDPVVTTQNSLAAGAITGTKYSPVCWTNSCDFLLTVPTPASTTLTNIYASFEYFATGACFAQDGGFSIDFGTCKYPSAAPGVITCAFAVSNFNCGILNATTLPDFTSCLPAPQCAAQNLDFTLHFYRCNNDPSLTCGNACIRASQPWVMTIEGRTMEMIYNSPNQVICGGDSIDVVTITQFGVPPYHYVWSPALPDNDTVRVSPSVTTNYTVTATDACGSTGSGSSTVQVTPYNNPGFSISPSSACTGQAVSLLGFGAGPVSSYDWQLPGSNAPGGVITNSKSPIIQYALPGTYPITLKYTSSTCVFDSTVNITINGVTPAQVSLASSPAGAVCPGDSIRFSASPANGGTSPAYDWYIDGLLVQSGSADTMKSNAFVNGSLVQVVMQSNSQCASPQSDTASLFVVFSNAVSPAVSISPDTSICPGSSLTFNASPVNGGATPQYQWTINGIAVPGANMNSFNTTLNSNDSIVGVNMISSLTCVVTANAGDTMHVNFISPVTPVTAISANPAGAVCAGDTIHFTANSLGGGSSPLFHWYLNGVSAGAPASDSSFTLMNPAQGDSVSVVMTSSFSCLQSSTAQSWSIVTVTAAASPAVSLNVSPSPNACQGDTLIFTASATAAGSQPLYHWYLNGNLIPVSDSLYTTSSLSDADIIRVEVISSLSCAIVSSDTDSVSVSISPVSNPFVSIANTGNGTCVGDLVTWTASALNSGNAPQYQWMVNGVQQGGNQVSFSYMPQDGDQVQVELTSNSPCALNPVARSNIFTVNLLPYVTPVVSIHADPYDTICPGQAVSITSSIVNGGSSPVYQWTVNGNVIGESGPVIAATNWQYNDIIQLNVISNAPCTTRPDTSSNIIRILMFPPVNVIMSGTGNLCPGTALQLSVAASGGAGGPYSYLWEHSLEQTDTVTVSPEYSTLYKVQVQDNCHGTFVSDSIWIPVLPGPVSVFSYKPDEVSTLNNHVTFVNHSGNAVSWEWDFGDSTGSTILNPEHIYDSAGTYTVTLITQSSNSCTDTLRYRLLVREDISVFLPSAFTPNGDNLNETWQPLGVSLEKYTYYIFDRWGQLIFEGNQDIAWDGHVKSTHTPAQNGVYIYRLDLNDEKFPDKSIVGRLSLIR